MISESDWKKFKVIKEAALDRFYGVILKDVEGGLNSEKSPSNHDLIKLKKILTQKNMLNKTILGVTFS